MQRLRNLCSLHQKIAKYGNSKRENDDETMRMMPRKINRRLGQGKQRLIVFAYGWLYNGDKQEGNAMNDMGK
jgi:hypothetical protein